MTAPDFNNEDLVYRIALPIENRTALMWANPLRPMLQSQMYQINIFRRHVMIIIRKVYEFDVGDRILKR